MPETAVKKDHEPPAAPDDVTAKFLVRKRPAVDAVSIAKRVQALSDLHLDTGSAGLLRLHLPSDVIAWRREIVTQDVLLATANRQSEKRVGGLRRAWIGRRTPVLILHHDRASEDNLRIGICR